MNKNVLVPMLKYMVFIERYKNHISHLFISNNKNDSVDFRIIITDKYNYVLSGKRVCFTDYIKYKFLSYRLKSKHANLIHEFHGLLKEYNDFYIATGSSFESNYITLSIANYFAYKFPNIIVESHPNMLKKNQYFDLFGYTIDYDKYQAGLYFDKNIDKNYINILNQITDRYYTHKHGTFIGFLNHLIEREKELCRRIKEISKYDREIGKHLMFCDNAYRKSIIGKIRTGTELTNKEIEEYGSFVDSYTELIKVKSFLGKRYTRVDDISDSIETDLDAAKRKAIECL